jgi:hypothetical protein
MKSIACKRCNQRFESHRGCLSALSGNLAEQRYIDRLQSWSPESGSRRGITARARIR